MKEINAKCGAGTIMRFGDNSHADVYVQWILWCSVQRRYFNMLTQFCLSCRPVTSSGALTLDLALGGGYPTGKIVEV